MSGPSSPQSSSPLAGAAEDEELLRLSPRAVLERRATCFAGLFAADFRAAVAAQERKLAAGRRGCGPYGTRLAAVRLTDLTLGDPPAEFGIANWRSVGVLGGFVGGAASGVIIATLVPGFLTRGCATALGVTYAAMLLIQDNMGRLALPERLGLIYSE